MTRRGQGVRSSRTSPASAKDRRRLRTLDRRISELDRLILYRCAFYGVNIKATAEKRQKLDAERKALRIAIKSPKREAWVAKQVDASDLKSGGVYPRAGSTPASGNGELHEV